MVVDEPHRLHERIHRRGADEPPATPLEILRERPRLLARRDLCKRGAVELAVSWRGVESPDGPGRRALRIDELDGALGVVDGRFDLAAVTDDLRIGQQPLDVAAAETSDAVKVKAG